MKYLEELLNEFEDLPQNIILHADLLRRGIKMNEDLKKAGEKSCQTGPYTKLQHVLMINQDMPPSQFHFKSDETTVDIRINKKSNSISYLIYQLPLSINSGLIII